MFEDIQQRTLFSLWC